MSDKPETNEVKDDQDKKAKDNEKKADYKGQHRTNPFWYCIQLGFFAGLIWGMVRWLLYTFHFTTIIPGFLADPFFRHSFLLTGWGHLSGLGCFIIFSIAATLIYKLVLGRIRGPWCGVAYGLVWWAILFAVVCPMLKVTPPLNKWGLDSMISECCVFLIWGLFIGYTIAFEFTDEASREPLGGSGKLTKMGS
ncbi:YqhR family membrane protein [Paenibacillus nasutitermitis]|uniref:Uncharacterized protein n=1 Tax=Paenibacillus nasutitermitis TaxID=1652958 RepID=A0A917DVB7_9BACL|nr:YqhR family membrane protein [Paenibacillus nasutitermitis]GGD70264.1 hypothetical protein GCM10010911_30150 [Paenibacillus nasutitermitis]